MQELQEVSTSSSEYHFFGNNNQAPWQPHFHPQHGELTVLSPSTSTSAEEAVSQEQDPGLLFQESLIIEQERDETFGASSSRIVPAKPSRGFPSVAWTSGVDW